MHLLREHRCRTFSIFFCWSALADPDWCCVVFITSLSLEKPQNWLILSQVFSVPRSRKIGGFSADSAAFVRITLFLEKFQNIMRDPSTAPTWSSFTTTQARSGRHAIEKWRSSFSCTNNGRTSHLNPSIHNHQIFLFNLKLKQWNCQLELSSSPRRQLRLSNSPELFNDLWLCPWKLKETTLNRPEDLSFRTELCQ